ncbi:MAG: PepSY domain-containing protein [Methylococcales bacterium]
MNMQIRFSKTFHRVFIGSTAIILCTLVIGNNLMADDKTIAKQTEISLDTAVNKVRRHYIGGKVINTKVENTDNGKIFVIKMISVDSRVMHIIVDAHSGEIYK